MNYLAHLHLGGPGREDRLGSLYGDFVKGSPDAWPAGIAAGIRLHRRIDVYTDDHPLVRQAKARLPAARRRVAGLLVDVFFDHCLARHWLDYADQPLPVFVTDCYRTLLQEPELPPRLARIAPLMARQDWLGSYTDFAVLEQVVDGMARRLSRPELLAGAFSELDVAYEGLLEDFRRFYPQLQAFAAAGARDVFLAECQGGRRGGAWSRSVRRCAVQVSPLQAVRIEGVRVGEVHAVGVVKDRNL